jgi:lipopolysaccharide transport system permease protein
MKWLIKLLGLTLAFSSWYLKNKYGWIGSLIYPLSFYVIISVLGGVEKSQHAIIGALISLLWMGGVSFLPQFLYLYKYTKLKEMFVAAPINPLVYMLGAAFSVLVASLPPMAVFLILLVACMKIAAIEALSFALVLLGTWLMSSTLGFVIAGYVKDPTQIGTIAPWAGAILTALPPIYYPLEALPPQYRILALIAPTTHLAQLARISIKLSHPLYYTPLHVIAIFAFFIMFILLAAFKSQWREK